MMVKIISNVEFIEVTLIFFRIFVENYFAMIPFKKIGIIGAGNVAFVFSKVLKNNGLNPKYILIRNKEKISEVEKSFGIETIVDYKTILDCDLIIIAVKDDAIADVASNLNNYKGFLVHTSGTQKSDILNCVECFGVLYPLQTLTKDFDVDFKNVPLLINASSTDGLLRLKKLAGLISNVVVECSDDDRSYIHMSAVYVSNFVNVMLQIGNKLLENKNLNVSVLESLVLETVRKSFALGPEKALTGPAKRGDINTINKHKLMLDNNLEEKMIYEMLTNYILNKY